MAVIVSLCPFFVIVPHLILIKLKDSIRIKGSQVN